ncbi:helix-turn-helix transcriptional regulator [Bacillus sp. ISL-57]|uniref:helix-turn-helix domain-containing protein n=1 Tax=Bacillus sp. ISL-57 TaxID=2819135 RepID=UPI002035ECC1|nr:helix-turn-helix transcriptional regulator [Bacillus sp. ISL-57]
MSANKKLLTPMVDNGFVSSLEATLKELDITKNALAVEAKVRPATINDLVTGNAKQVNFETLKAVIDALNRKSLENGAVKRFSIEDVFIYNPNKKDSE